MTSKPNAVFLHTGYRTAGTWLWSRFRELPGVTAYYEPLHEMLATLDRATLDKSTADSWRSGHPQLDTPYFAEYADLLDPERCGVPGFDERFAIDRFTADAPVEAERIEAYLQGLIDAAHARGTVPVFKFCRSLGRLPWFRATFADAAHIVVEKNPISQWQSCWELFALHGNAHFVAVPLAVLASNLGEPIVTRVLNALKVDLPFLPGSPETQTLAASLAFYKQQAGQMPAADVYRAFLAHWLLTLQHAATHAQAIFDCDLAVRSPAYAHSAERWIESLTGLTPTLSNARRSDSQQRDCGFDSVQGLRIHLAAMQLCKQLVLSGDAHEDSYTVWATKIAQATQIMAFGTDVNWPQQYTDSQRSVRMVELALVDGVDIDSALASELAATRHALATSRRQLAQLQRSLWFRVTRPVRRWFGNSGGAKRQTVVRN